MSGRRGAIKAVIWDFNGTLINDSELCVRSVNAQLDRRDLPTLTVETYRDVFGFPVADYYRRIGLNPDVEPMSDLSAEFFATYAPGLSSCPLHEGVQPTLHALRDAGIRQFILSAMEQEILEETLAQLGIAEFFDGVYGLSHLEGDSKLDRGRELFADFSIDPATTLMVGDTAHDAEVAVELGMQIALVGTGHQSEARLRSTGVDVLQGAAGILSLLD